MTPVLIHSNFTHQAQYIGEWGGLFFNIFFIHLLYKYFNRFNNLEKIILISFIILTFIIEIYLLSQWDYTFLKNYIKKDLIYNY
jgi:hypothetical protein